MVKKDEQQELKKRTAGRSPRYYFLPDLSKEVNFFPGGASQGRLFHLDIYNTRRKEEDTPQQPTIPLSHVNVSQFRNLSLILQQNHMSLTDEERRDWMNAERTLSRKYNDNQQPSDRVPIEAIRLLVRAAYTLIESLTEKEQLPKEFPKNLFGYANLYTDGEKLKKPFEEFTKKARLTTIPEWRKY
jgi:hypothetical protein